MIIAAGEDVGEPGLRIDAVELGRLDERQHEVGALAAAIGTGEQPGLLSERYCPFILPMSGRGWTFITDGIRILAARCKSKAPRDSMSAASVRCVSPR